MHKFAPFRKRQLRYARSEDALSEAVPGVDGHIDSAQNLENVSESYAQMISTLIAKQHQGNPSNHRPGQKWSVWPTNEEPNQANSHSASPVPKNLPAYTPMPVPQRISSNREAVVYEQRSAGHHPTRTNHDQANKPHVDSDRDDISLGIGSAFDEDLVMQPRTPVSPLLPPKTLMPPAEVGESPVLGRLRCVGNLPSTSELLTKTAAMAASRSPSSIENVRKALLLQLIRRPRSKVVTNCHFRDREFCLHQPPLLLTTHTICMCHRGWALKHLPNYRRLHQTRAMSSTPS